MTLKEKEWIDAIDNFLLIGTCMLQCVKKLVSYVNFTTTDIVGVDQI